MSIDFGTVSKYFADKGFGFVRHTFGGCGEADVFFHIKSIKKTNPDLAAKLDQDEAIDGLYFWYETEVTNKGEQVRRVVHANEVQSCAAGSLTLLTSKVETLWKDIASTQPKWLEEVTLALVGEKRAGELWVEREILQDARRLAAESGRQKAAEERKAQQDLEEREFAQLVAEMKPLGFSESRDVSRYIVRNRLGLKYQNISGIVRMMQSDDMWDFKGGFPPKIYARLCEALDIGNQGTRAQAVGFTPFKDLLK